MRTATLSLMMLCLAGGAAAQDEARQPQVPTVVTQGESVLRRAPDRAYVDLAVETRAARPADASSRNAQLMTAVQQKLRGIGLPADAIQTRAFELHPEFDYVNGKQVPRGYTARNRIEVRVDEIAQAAVVIDSAIEAGATNAGGIRFDLRDRDAVEREALKLAVADARARAEAAAAGAGMTVTRVLKIQEAGQPEIGPPMPMMAAVREMKADVPTPISAGDIEIRARVTLTVEIR